MSDYFRDFDEYLRGVGFCQCTMCSESRMLKRVNKVTPELMGKITNELLRDELVKAICLGKYPMKRRRKGCLS